MNSNLKTFRKAGRLSLESLADAVGSSKSYMWELEQSKANPSLQLAYKISAVLGVTVYEIWPDPTEVVEEIIAVRRVVAR